MIRIHRIAAGVAAAVAVTFGLFAASPAAFAQTFIIPGPDNVGHHQLTPAQSVVIGGMPGWQITLIAVGAALVAAAVAVLADRARAARRQLAHAS
jgi:hypothetical protein